MSTEDLTPLKMFSQQTYYEPTPTISLADADLRSTSSQSPEPSHASDSPAPEGDDQDKKPVKKRKSWGQELPVPKTNLPPRKRAKTEDEKEQRRIERVLRNRAAAQSSRERKRQEVEKLEGEKKAIEDENNQLRQRVLAVEDEKYQLQQQLSQLHARLGHNPDMAAIAPGSVSPEPVVLHIKSEPLEQRTGLPSPEPSRQGSISGSSGNRSRSASLQSQGMAPPMSKKTTSVRPVPAPLDLTHRPAEMMLSHDLQFTDGQGHDARDASVANNVRNGMSSHDNLMSTQLQREFDFAVDSAITISVNGQTVDTISDVDIANQMTPAMSSGQDCESFSSTFDAMLNEMSPNAPTSSVFTPSPEAPSLSFFDESISAGSPSEELQSPDFVAYGGDFDFDFSLDGTIEKLGDQILFPGRTQMFSLENEFVDLESHTPSLDLTT